MRAGEEDDVVDAAQRGDQLGACRSRRIGRAAPFSAAHRGVVVDGDDEPIGLVRRAPADSARGRRAAGRTAVGEGDGPARRAIGREQALAASFGIDSPPASASSRRGGSPTRRSAGETVAVPRFMTTSPPA